MTSLSKQLRNLAVPQTSGLADLKKRPSILFDAKEAATKDRKTIYDLGCQGLAELIALNHAFAQFEDTLFQHSSLHLERSVEDSKFNKALDKNIKKMFFHLSPYFMLRSAHMCLEWLIRRFRVHEYNKDSFMSLILPYHETNIFVKCVQIMKIKNPLDPWNWLRPIQKPGVTLPKSVIINRAANEQSFLSLICRNVIEATNELGNRACTLQCLINFYCAVVIGAFENCGKIKEWHITTTLPSIIKGMKSRVVDFISASLMITSQLVCKTTISEKLLDILVSQIWKINCEHLQSASVLLLGWITKTQAETYKYLPTEGFADFVSNEWLTTTVSVLSREGISIHYIVIVLIRTAINIIQNNATDAAACKLFLENLLYNVRLSDFSSKIVIGSVLQAFSLTEDKKPELSDGDIIDLESDTEVSAAQSTTSWYSNILSVLERQYPSAFDAIIKEAMQSDSEDMPQNAINLALSIRYKFLDTNTSSIFQNIYHANPRIRAKSVEEIVKQITQGNNAVQNCFLRETLADRIKDDNETVIAEILKLPTNRFIEIIGCNLFVENLTNILDKAANHPDSWGYLQTAALTHLTSDLVVKQYDNNLILLSVMQYLFPINIDEESARYIKLILKSPFAENMLFLRKMVQNLKTEIVNPMDFKKQFLNVISVSNDTPRAEALVESIRNSGHNYFKTTVHVSHFLMMVTACFKLNNEPEITQDILNFTVKQCTPFKIIQFNNKKWISASQSNVIPLQLFIDFLYSSVRGTNFVELLNWESPTKSLELFLEIFNILTSNAFSTQFEANEKREWGECLKNILNILFPTTKDKLNFLSQFFLYDSMSSIENFTELRIRSIRLLELILKAEIEMNNLDLRLILKVIVALSSPLSTVRACALNVLRKLSALPGIEESQIIMDKIIQRSEEIQFDAEQLPLILFTILSSKNKKDILDNGFLLKILSITDDPTESILFKSKILEILKHIKGTKILKAMIPVALEALNNINVEGSISFLGNAASNVFKSVITRFDENCIQKVITTDKKAWLLIENSLKMSKIFTNHMNEKLIPVPCITLQIFDEVTYNQLPTAYKMKFLKLVVETISLSENDALFLDINKALRRCYLDCKHVLPSLESMNNVCENTNNLPKKRIADKYTTTDINFITTSQWKEGVILLEVLENKKKLQNTHVLIPILFDILKKCLDMENQSPFEYTKQLILSALLQSCQKSKAENLLQSIPENTFRVDLIVHCIRITQNPQTHYNALLLLSHCAVHFPQQVLHNLVDIFTFMGSSIARHDDAFSFQVISNIVESIIPILVQEKHSTTATKRPVNDLVIPVLKIFSDILLDVPEHRRIPLYSKLLHTLGAEKYFWLFLCVVFDSQVVNDEQNKLSTKKRNQRILTTTASSAEKLPSRIEIALQLLHEFSTDISLQTCVSLMSYVKMLPMNKEETSCNTNTLSKTLETPVMELFDIKARSGKQLRHYKYLILQFVSTFTSSVEFLKAITELEQDGNESTKPLYQNFIIKTLSYIPDVSAAMEKSVDGQIKFWKVIMHHCYDALDNVISLLSPDMFLVVVHGLMQHKLITIRKKVIELLINKLQEKNDCFENCKEENILKLLNSLCELISTISVKDRHGDSSTPVSSALDTNEMIFVQQAGLIAVKLLSKEFALKYIEQFKNIIVVLTSVTKRRAHMSKILLATAILTLVEVISHLKAHGICHLPKFVPYLVDTLKDQAIILQKQQPDNVCLALITGIQKLFEAMPLFLGPYIVGIITALSKIWSRIQLNNIEQEQRKMMNINKLHLIRSKIATEVPARVLIPNCEKAYYVLMEDQSYSSISFLMKLFLECVSNSSISDLAVVQTELTEFFLKSLQFRSQMGNADLISMEEISKTEMEIINALVAWILKQSESSFRPVYKKIYDWAIHSDGPKERVLTYFILNKCISNSLKSLFVLFASDFIEDCAELLTACNTSKNQVLYFSESEMLNAELIKNILSTLTTVFVHGKGFVNTQRFNILMQPIVDQLENNLIQNNDELQNILSSCIGQLAVAVSNDVLWKQLNYQILLKTRTNVPQIRIIAFNCCVELARKLGEDFTSLLPETIPFVAELFEDENPHVVQNLRKAVQELEVILGESLQRYL